jgi:hypothetical protein
MAAGVADFRAVNGERAVVESRNEGRSGDRPEAIGLLRHVELRPAPEIEPNFAGVGRLDPELRPGGAVDTRPERIRNIGGGWLELAGLLCAAQARKHDKHNECDSNSLHSVLLPG